MLKLFTTFLLLVAFCSQITAQNVGIGTITAPTNRLHISATSNPLRIEGLISGAATDSLLTVDANGVLRRRTSTSVVGGLSWTLAGNTSTNASTQFIGTTDFVSLVFRTLNQRSGFLDYDSSKRNNSFGNRAMVSTLTGVGNNAFGFQTMRMLTGGSNNTAMGDSAGFNINTGMDNILIGADAGRAITIGNQNVGVGSRVLSGEGAGSNNIALGFRSLENSLASDNLAIGTMALNKSLGATNSLAFGNNCLANFTGSTFNMAIGNDALTTVTTGSENLAYGYRSGFNLTTQIQNTLIGNYTLSTVGTGTANYNTMIGYQACSNMTSGSNNVAVGWLALGNNFLTGSNNTFIGYNADATNAMASFSNSGAFGYNVAISASNTIRVGNSSVSSIGGQVGWTTVSDERVKTNIEDDVQGLNFITKLKPLSYNYNLELEEKYLHNNSTIGLFNSTNTVKRFSGFMAQDVLKIANKIGYNFSGIDIPENENGLYGLRYAEFVVPLVKSVQELKLMVDKQQEQIMKLELLLKIK